jgi:hypothetical protein
MSMPSEADDAGAMLRLGGNAEQLRYDRNVSGRISDVFFDPPERRLKGRSVK